MGIPVFDQQQKTKVFHSIAIHLLASFTLFHDRMNVFCIHCGKNNWRFRFSRTWNSHGISGWQHLIECWWIMTCDFFFGSWGCEIFWPLQSSVLFHLESVLWTGGKLSGPTRERDSAADFICWNFPCVPASAKVLFRSWCEGTLTRNFLIVWSAQRRLHFLLNRVARCCLSGRMWHKVHQLLMIEGSGPLSVEHPWTSSCF